MKPSALVVRRSTFKSILEIRSPSLLLLYSDLYTFKSILEILNPSSQTSPFHRAHAFKSILEILAIGFQIYIVDSPWTVGWRNIGVLLAAFKSILEIQAL